MQIHVTEEDIQKGEQLKCNGCPISLAVQRHTNAAYVAVSTCDVYIRMNRHTQAQTFLLPAEAREFLQNFDYNRPVEPFSFYLRPNYDTEFYDSLFETIPQEHIN